MEIKVTRNTGFYAMGSPLVVKLNEDKFYLSNNQSIDLEVNGPFTMQVSFFWLKSPVYHFDRPSTHYTVTMNMLLLQLYPFLFIFSAISAMFFQNILYSLLMVVIVVSFFFSIKNKAYVIKEETNEKF